MSDSAICMATRKSSTPPASRSRRRPHHRHHRGPGLDYCSRRHRARFPVPIEVTRAEDLGLQHDISHCYIETCRCIDAYGLRHIGRIERSRRREAGPGILVGHGCRRQGRRDRQAGALAGPIPCMRESSRHHLGLRGLYQAARHRPDGIFIDTVARISVQAFKERVCGSFRMASRRRTSPSVSPTMCLSSQMFQSLLARRVFLRMAAGPDRWACCERRRGRVEVVAASRPGVALMTLIFPSPSGRTYLQHASCAALRLSHERIARAPDSCSADQFLVHVSGAGFTTFGRSSGAIQPVGGSGASLSRSAEASIAAR